MQFAVFDHYAKFDISDISGVQESLNVKVFTTYQHSPPWPA